MTFSADIRLASQAFKGQLPWSTVASTIEAQAAAWLHADPTASALVATSIVVAKQGLSNAIGQVDSALASNQGRIASATEMALEAELAALSHGATLPFNGIITDGIDKLVAAAITAAHAFGLRAKASLATPAT